MNNILNKLKEELQNCAKPEKIKVFKNFFKTGIGEYAEGDEFIGVNVPNQRKIAKKYFAIVSFGDIQKLLKSKIHEYRLTALFILVAQFQKVRSLKCKQDFEKKIVDFYLVNIKYINNWDLVDSSAYHLLGRYLLSKSKVEKKVLYNLAKSNNLWKKRIAMISTFYFIKNNEYEDALKIAEILLYDDHDLIQKVVGWMLREIGKRDLEIEEKFLDKNYKTMPRTMLRYAIERFLKEKRKYYMKKV